MSLFGKILAVFNVLAAIGFLVVAGLDYSQRSQWSYAHFRYQIALYGLPVGNDDNTWRLPGRSIASDLTPNTLNDLYKGLQGPFAGNIHKTQLDELNWLQSKIEVEVNQAPDIDSRRAVLAKYLVPIQKTGEDRERIITQLRAAKDGAALEALSTTLKAAFADAASESTGAAGALQSKRDLQDRRRMIADLLYNIMPSNEWHARVQTVVGIEEYAAAADRQAARLGRMAQRLRDAIADERTKFVNAYETLLPELRNLSLDLKRYEDRLAEQKALLSRYTAMKNTRTGEVADLNQKITTATALAAKETADLQALQQRLFAVEQQLATAQAENQRLERDIRAQETGK